MSLSERSWWARGLILIARAIHIAQVRLAPEGGDGRAARLTQINARQLAALIYTERTRVTTLPPYNKKSPPGGWREPQWPRR